MYFTRLLDYYNPKLSLVSLQHQEDGRRAGTYELCVDVASAEGLRGDRSRCREIVMKNFLKRKDDILALMSQRAELMWMMWRLFSP